MHLFMMDKNKIKNKILIINTIIKNRRHAKTSSNDIPRTVVTHLSLNAEVVIIHSSEQHTYFYTKNFKDTLIISWTG